jgi:hypothetical protein
LGIPFLRCLQSSIPAKNKLVWILPRIFSALIPCKCVELAQNIYSWESTYIVAEKIEEKRSRGERMEEFS